MRHARASLHGLDRSNWPTQVYHVPPGITYHHPAYLGANVQRFSVVNVLDRRLTFAQRYDLALSGGESLDLGKASVFEASKDYFYAAKDIVLLPIHVVQAPPWSVVSTPATNAPRHIVTPPHGS